MSDPVAVTIAMPSFNRAALVEETLRSLSAQTLDAWECLVVDDGSTDGTPEVVQAYAELDPRVRLFLRDRDPKGACTCRNIAVERGGGRYVMFLDTDDLLAPYALEQRVAVLDENPALDFAVFPMALFHDDRPEGPYRLWNVETGEDDLLRVLQLDPVCQGTGPLWRRDSFIRAGGWDEALRIWQDVELHVRAFSGEYRYEKRLDLPPDGFIREHGTSLSRGGYFDRQKLESRAEVVRRAAAYFRSQGLDRYVSELRTLAAAVVTESARVRQFDLADGLRQWGREEGVFTPQQARALRIYTLLHRTRLVRLGPFRRLAVRLTAPFHVERTLGTVPYEPEAERAPVVLTRAEA